MKFDKNKLIEGIKKNIEEDFERNLEQKTLRSKVTTQYDVYLDQIAGSDGNVSNAFDMIIGLNYFINYPIDEKFKGKLESSADNEEFYRNYFKAFRDSNFKSIEQVIKYAKDRYLYKSVDSRLARLLLEYDKLEEYLSKLLETKSAVTSADIKRKFFDELWGNRRNKTEEEYYKEYLSAYKYRKSMKYYTKYQFYNILLYYIEKYSTLSDDELKEGKTFEYSSILEDNMSINSIVIFNEYASSVKVPIKTGDMRTLVDMDVDLNYIVWETVELIRENILPLEYIINLRSNCNISESILMNWHLGVDNNYLYTTLLEDIATNEYGRSGVDWLKDIMMCTLKTSLSNEEVCLADSITDKLNLAIPVIKNYTYDKEDVKKSLPLGELPYLVLFKGYDNDMLEYTYVFNTSSSPKIKKDKIIKVKVYFEDKTNVKMGEKAIYDKLPIGLSSTELDKSTKQSANKLFVFEFNGSVRFSYDYLLDENHMYELNKYYIKGFKDFNDAEQDKTLGLANKLYRVPYNGYVYQSLEILELMSDYISLSALTDNIDTKGYSQFTIRNRLKDDEREITYEYIDK